MTVEELKAETAKLPPGDRFALADWIVESEEVRDLRREKLISELQRGVDQADRGELIDADTVFARLRRG
jgi:predicted transcriptional regulator